MKRTAVALFVLVALVACDSANRQDQRAVNTQQEHYAAAQPIPFFDHSQDRDVLTQIYEAKNEARQTTSIIESFTGELLFTCPSIGYGIPADTQLTNPLGLLSEGSATVVEQAEPNGLYSSKNTDATYVLCVRDNGDVSPIYTEEKVTVFPFGIEIGEDGVITDAGDDSSITVEIVEPAE